LMLFLCRIHSEIAYGQTHTWLQIKELKKSVRSPSFVKFCTLTPKIFLYYLPLHRATTTAIQMAAPVPEIRNVPSYAHSITSLQCKRNTVN
jgi:hypothetical protein